MKRTLLFLFLVVSSYLGIKAQNANFSSYLIYCEEIKTETSSNTLRSYLLENFPEKISQYTANLSDQTAVVVTIVQPIDILQLYRQNGYEAVLLENGKRYFLNIPGDQLVTIKE